MKRTATIIVALFAIAGCTREPVLDVSGNWYFFCRGPLTIVQDGKKLTGTGYLPLDDRPTRDSPSSLAVTVQGEVRNSSILMTMQIGTNTLHDLEFIPSISPKGNQRFLKCSKHLYLTLIPEGVDFFKHEILKPELTEQRNKLERSQQPAGAVTQEPAQSAAP